MTIETLPRKANPALRAQETVLKPWGSELIWTQGSHYVGKFLFIKKSHRLSYQYHEIKEESIYILEGKMDLEYETDGIKTVIRLQPGDSFHIPALMKHRMIAIEDCKVVEVSTPYLDDVVRLEDAYGRISAQ